MDNVRLALVLITVAITVGPFLGVIIAYRNNLSGLIVPPEINQLLNGGPSDLTGGQPSGISDFINSWISGNQTIPDNINQIIPEQPVLNYDPITRTFTANFTMKNPSDFDMSINAINGTVECDEHHFPIGPVHLQEPVTLKANGTGIITITGEWSEAGVAHLETAHQGQQYVRCSLVDAVFSTTIKGLTATFPSPDAISLGEVPLTGAD
jgi:hypothetical protein